MPDHRDAAATALLLGGARLADGRTVDVRLTGERVEAVGTPGSLPATAPGVQRLDLTGYLLLPAPAEPHAHHDTALTSGCPGPPPEGPDQLRRRIIEASLLQLSHGATAQRSQIRIGDVLGLRALEAAQAARRALLGLAELQPVAAPRLLTGRAGADNRAQLADAAQLGGTALGGCPDLDPDPAGYADIVLSIADAQGCAIDLHTDADDPARFARLVTAAGACRTAVTLGPCAGLSLLPPDTAARAADQLAAAGVAVSCLPQSPCAALPAPPRPSRPPTPPVRTLLAAGVTVAAGSGAVRDAGNPVGRGDPLEAAYLLAVRGACDTTGAYRAISSAARAVLGLPKVRIEPGFPAELLAVRGENLPGALSLAYSRLVIHRGRVVARTSAVREYCGSPAVPLTELPRQPAPRT
ncbi:amidohydrolase family protein [Streptomyces sp. JH002]|uniref:amidohydrolase family protein n=1 Tax=Streptomyces TaxID=1883 RepID=UPI003691F248